MTMTMIMMTNFTAIEFTMYKGNKIYPPYCNYDIALKETRLH
jgi:hypothetical protein